MPPQPVPQHSLSASCSEDSCSQSGAQVQSMAVPALQLLSVAHRNQSPGQGHSILSVAPVCFISSAKHEFILEQDVLGIFTEVNKQ